MAKSVKWTERFGISEEEVAQWRAENGGDQAPDALASFLFSGRIDEAQYLEWATEVYELPSVIDDFFSVPIDSVFWVKVKNLASWSSALVPLAEWDGVIIVGCLEPKIDLKLPMPHAFVLAKSTPLAGQWARLNPEQKVKEGTQSAASLGPINLDLAQESANTPAPPPVDEGSIEEAPDGVILTKLTTVTGGNLLSSDAAPDGFAVSSGGLSDEDNAPVVEMPEGLTVIGLTTAKSASFSGASAPDSSNNEPALLSLALNTNLPRPEDIDFTSGPSQSESPSEKAAGESKIAEAQTSTNTYGRSSPIVNPVGEAKNLEDCRSFAELAEHTLGHVVRTFEGGMILLFERGTLTPWKWTTLMSSPKNSEVISVSLENASIFRIVYRTLLPYHGPVHPSAENDRFFAAFHGGILPKHVTLVPVIHENEIRGMIMGTASLDVNRRSALIHLEKLALDLGQNMLRLRGQTAA